MKGALLFLIGLLLGANAVYFWMSRHDGGEPVARMRTAPAASSPASSLPGASGPRTIQAPQVPASPSASPAAATGATPGEAATTAQSLLIPVQGITAAQLTDTFDDTRGTARIHEALDIMAAAGTPVFAVADGTVAKLFDSKPGGLTIYQFDPTGTHAYYYAHLQGYAPGLAEGQALRRGQVIGYVGSTGNADPAAPHLHFAIFRLGPERNWWQGTPVNPYPLLR